MARLAFVVAFLLAAPALAAETPLFRNYPPQMTGADLKIPPVLNTPESYNFVQDCGEQRQGQ